MSVFMIMIKKMAASLKVGRLLQFGLRKPLLDLKHSFSKCRCLRQLTESRVVPDSVRKWQLHSAVILQRNPVISAELNPLEQEYQDYLDDIELNSSLLSDHELHDKNIRGEKKGESAKENLKGSEKTAILTAQELEDAWNKERDQFQLADRITDADRNNDMSSVDRKLDQKLILIVKQKWSNNTKSFWLFPQIQREEGESMRETAERALRTHCGEQTSAVFLGNAPIAYNKYKLPEGHTDHGVKLFLFKADYQGGDIVPNPNSVEDYKWITVEEMRNYLSPSDLKIYKYLFE